MSRRIPSPPHTISDQTLTITPMSQRDSLEIFEMPPSPPTGRFSVSKYLFYTYA